MMKTLLSVVVGSIVVLSLLECVSGAPVIPHRRQGKVRKITKQHNHNATHLLNYFTALPAEGKTEKNLGFVLTENEKHFRRKKQTS